VQILENVAQLEGPTTHHRFLEKYVGKRWQQALQGFSFNEFQDQVDEAVVFEQVTALTMWGDEADPAVSFRG